MLVGCGGGGGAGGLCGWIVRWVGRVGLCIRYVATHVLTTEWILAQPRARTQPRSSPHYGHPRWPWHGQTLFVVAVFFTPS